MNRVTTNSPCTDLVCYTSPMAVDRKRLAARITEAQKRPMSSKEREAQRRSFAYGSGSLERDLGVTRLSVEIAAKQLALKDS